MTRAPDFFLVGAARAGTTSLTNYLVQHPAVFVPGLKELHFFADHPPARAARFAGFEEYLRVFEGCPEGVRAGDASTSYLSSPSAPVRIAEICPNARILILLRDPIDRAWSHYWHKRRNFDEDLSFEDAIRAEGRRTAEGWPFDYRYVDNGKYHDKVSRFLDAFGEGRVFIRLFEDLVEDADRVCRDCFRFLGVPPLEGLRTGRRYNPGGTHRVRLLGRLLTVPFPGRRWLSARAPRGLKALRERAVVANLRAAPEMDPRTRARLRDEFGEDVARLERLLGRPLSGWLGAG